MGLGGSGVDVLEQVAPGGVGLADQAQFPLAVPVLHPFLADDGLVDILVAFDVDQPDQAMLAAELRAAPRAVLDNPRGEVGGDADVQRAVRRVGHDVDPAAFHGGQANPTLAWGLANISSSPPACWREVGWAPACAGATAKDMGPNRRSSG